MCIRDSRKIDGDYYCFDEYGRMRTGWINVDGEDTIKSYRLMGSDGRMRTGWYSSTPPEDLEGDIFEDEVNWYYFSSKGEPYICLLYTSSACPTMRTPW